MSEQTSTLFIYNALINGEKIDLTVENGRIRSIEKAGSAPAPQGAETLDAQGKILFPSLIDAHTHLREPGFEWKEDIASGLNAAAHGGFGAIMCMGNTIPVNDKAQVTRFMLEKAATTHPHGPKLYPVGALTKGLEGTELAPMRELSDAGCVAFSNDGKPVPNTEIFRRGMEYAAMWGKVVIDHCEDPYLAKNSHMNEGITSGRIGVKGQPTVAEALHVARDILLAEYLGIPVHLAHISCRQSVELIVWAKSRGLPVTAETCPQYLHFDETLLGDYDTEAKVNPPLRSRNDVEYLRGALKDGVFDMLVTDHAPHAVHEKTTPLDEAPHGIIGLETALPLSYALVREGVITETQMVSLWSEGASSVFKLPLARLAVGESADFVLFDQNEEWIVGTDTLKTKGRNTPLWGKPVRGRVAGHWLAGKRIV